MTMNTPSPIILIVDDEPSIRCLLSDLLEGDGSQPIAVASAEQALEVLGQTRPDLIICDRKMPGMNGLQLLKVLRTAEETKSLPFIFFTGSYDAELVEEANKYGVTACLPKPFDIFELRGYIRRALQSDPS